MSASESPRLGASYAKRSYVLWSLLFAVLAGFNGGLEVAQHTRPSLLLIAFATWLTYRYARIPLIEVFADHVVLRSSVLASPTRIQLATVVELREPWKHNASLMVDVLGKTRRFQLPLGSMEPDDGDAMLVVLRRTLAARRVAMPVATANARAAT